jgi:hypothetical protein
MNRRHVLLLAATGIMIAFAAMGSQKKSGLLVLEWAGKASPEQPPLALLIELGRKDTKPAPWSGRAVVAGAKVVHREGYCFQDKDKLVAPDAWEASSHRPIRVPRNNAALAATEGIFPVGIVLHLADVQPDATLTIAAGSDRPQAVVAVKDVLAGQPKLLWDGAAAVRRISTATPVETTKTEDDFPAACYGPDGTLWVAYISYTVKEESRRIEPPSLKEQPKDFKAYYTPEFGDQLLVKYYRDGKWSEPIAVTGPKEDLVRCAIAVDGKGTVVVGYSANRNGSHNIYARPIAPKLGTEWKMAGDGTATYLSPVMCTTLGGDILLACQHWANGGTAGVFYMKGMSFQDTGWTSRESGSGGSGAQWNMAIAAGLNDQWQLACDSYAHGDYDVQLPYRGDGTRTQGGGSQNPVANSSRFEARPSVCYDPKGRLWVAYEEGPENWGKNFGVFDDRGNPLYFARTARVICLADGKLMKPVAELPPLAPHLACPDTGQKAEKIPRYAYPQIGIDGKGRVWLTYRQKFGTRYSTHPGSYWLTFARRLDGDKWSEPIEIHHSDGLLDSRPVLLPHAAGGLRVIHNTDHRFTVPEIINNDIYMSYIDLPGDPVEPKLVPRDVGKKDDKLVQQAKDEQAAVKRIRDYRIEAGSKKYQLLRGEFHRHTEISWDGGPDGSLEDMFRYAIDAAAMDWIGNGDHDSGAGREYSWWLIQKFTDAYHVKERFTPMFTYERSVAYPHGHRNCMFAQRGVRTLPRLAASAREETVGGVHADDTKMLYRYLHELDGICAVHTSATGMGTDWRDNDPEVEPFVEIYQGDRMSYEIEGAPRAGYDVKSGKKPVNIAGWYPKGFINHAFQKGYRLGFQSSSDHSSTHISFCIALAEKHDRASILAALKKRHCYGATDDIIVDVRSGAHIMGDEFQTGEAPKLQIHVIGTHTLERIDVLKDSEVVDTLKPGKAEYQGTWTDPKPTAGVHWYYIRVFQADDELAWGSPMWINYAK